MDGRVLNGFVGVAMLLALIMALFGGGPAPADPTVRRLRRLQWAATVVGALAASLVVRGDEPGRMSVVSATLPAAGAALGVVVAAVAERFVPRPKGVQRVAALGIRQGTDRTGLEWRIGLGYAVSVLAGAVGWYSSGPDGYTGARWWGDLLVTTGPYPGRAYTLPLFLGLGLLAMVTWWGLRRVDARPAVRPQDPALDRALRLGSRIRVERWTAAGSLVTARGLCLTMGPKLDELTQLLRIAGGGAVPPVLTPRAPWDWAQNGGFAPTGVGVLLLLPAMSSLFWETPALRSSRASEAAAGGSVKTTT